MSKPEENKKISKPEENKKISKPEENKKISEPEENKKISESEENKKISEPEENKKISEPEENKKIKALPPLNELSFVMMFANIKDEHRDLFIEEPAEYIYSLFNLELPMELSVVENNKKTMHLALPYYTPQILNK